MAASCITCCASWPRKPAMPLVNISILKGKSLEYIKAIADGVNLAVIETMGFPRDDRYQRSEERRVGKECRL